MYVGFERCSFYLWSADVLTMDENERQVFKGKFTVCVLLMNAFSISGVCAVAIILVPLFMGKLEENPWVFAVSAVALVLFVVSLVFFIKKYKAAKAWLDVHGMTREERKEKEKMDLEEERRRIRVEMFEDMCNDLKRDIGDLTVKMSSAPASERASIKEEIDSKLLELKGYEEKKQSVLEGK